MKPRHPQTGNVGNFPKLLLLPHWFTLVMKSYLKPSGHTCGLDLAFNQPLSTKKPAKYM